MGLDPLRLLASGSLLIAAAPGSREALAAAFAGEKVGITRIGRFLTCRRGSWAVTGGERIPLRVPDRDELVRAHELLLRPAESGGVSKAYRIELESVCGVRRS